MLPSPVTETMWAQLDVTRIPAPFGRVHPCLLREVRYSRQVHCVIPLPRSRLYRTTMPGGGGAFLRNVKSWRFA